MFVGQPFWTEMDLIKGKKTFLTSRSECKRTRKGNRREQRVRYRRSASLETTGSAFAFSVRSPIPKPILALKKKLRDEKKVGFHKKKIGA